ncbi:MAG: hypothetical protein AB8G15_03470 [Saprospiraceae bacterium]
MNIKVLFFLALTSLFFTKLNAQGWKHTYGNQHFHAGKGVVQLDNNDLMMLVEADTATNFLRNRVSYLLRLNSAGTVIARDTFSLFFSQLEVLEDGQFLLYGLSPTPCIYKFNQHGIKCWQRNFTKAIFKNGVHYDPSTINGIVDLTDDNIFINLKYKIRNDAYALDGLQFLVKLDTQGNIITTTRSNFERGTAHLQGGRVHHQEVVFGHGFGNALLCKTNLRGEVIWNDETAYRKHLEALLVADNQELIITETGGTISRINTNGTLIWTNSTLANFGFQTDLTQLIKCLDGGFVIAGNINNYDLLVLKIDAAGNFVWKQIFESKHIHRIKGLIETDDGCYVLSGLQKNEGSDPFKAFLLKTDLLGLAHSHVFDEQRRAESEK